MAIGATISNIFQAYVGKKQLAAGQELEAGLERPEYEIPPEIYQNLSQAQRMALEGLPAEQKRQFVENVQRTMQTGLTGITERGGGLAGITSLAQSSTDAYRNLLGQDVAARQQNWAGLAQARSTVAGFRDVAFNINEMQPYAMDYMKAQSLMGAGMQNVMGGVQGIGQGIDQSTNQAMQMMMLMGGGGQQQQNLGI